jgi:hypothetical protein
MKTSNVVKNSLIIFFLSVSVSLGIQAEPVGDLYNTIVPVANQSNSERLRAMRVGLGKVLVKVTGDSQSLSGVSFANPERYVTQFGYVSYRNPMAAEGESDGLAMKLSYAESAVNRLLRQYQLQVWPSDRPGLLVWMVMDDPARGRQFVTAETMPEAVDLLAALMDDRGAPLIFPLLDLQDSQTISEADVWNLDQSKLGEASARYNTSAWLAIRFYKSSGGQWRAAQLFNLNDDNSLENVVADNLPALINRIVPEVVDKLASHYAYVPKEDAEAVFLQLNNVTDYQAFSDVTDYLESLEVVRRVSVVQVDNDRLDLQLFVEGDVSLLLDTLRRDQRMIEQPVVNPITVGAVVDDVDVNPIGDNTLSEEAVGVAGAALGDLSAEVPKMIDLAPVPQHFSFIWGKR